MGVLKESKIIANIYDKEDNIIETRHFTSRKQLDNYVDTLNNLVDMTMDKELYKNIKGDIDNITLRDVWKIVIDINITEEKKNKPFIKRDAGNVEQNITTFNSMMTTGDGQGFGESLKSLDNMNKRIKGEKRKMVKENLRNVSGVEEKSREVVSPAFASAVREIKTNDKFRDKASNILKTPKEGKEDLPTKLTLDESLFREEKESNIMRFIKGEFTRNELEQLRKDIVLNSIYTADYKNRFNIDPAFIQDFFDGYSGWLDEAEIPEEKEDNIDNLESWYYTMDYSDYVNDPYKLEVYYDINLNENLDDDVEGITKESEEGSIEVDDEDDKYEVIRNLKRKGYDIETSYNDLSHKYHIEYWK